MTSPSIMLLFLAFHIQAFEVVVDDLSAPFPNNLFEVMGRQTTANTYTLTKTNDELIIGSTAKTANGYPLAVIYVAYIPIPTDESSFWREDRDFYLSEHNLDLKNGADSSFVSNGILGYKLVFQETEIEDGIRGNHFYYCVKLPSGKAAMALYGVAVSSAPPDKETTDDIISSIINSVRKTAR